jgi:hypothetical protein
MLYGALTLEFSYRISDRAILGWEGSARISVVALRAATLILGFLMSIFILGGE